MAKKITVQIPYPEKLKMSEVDSWIAEIKESFKKDETVKKVEYLLEKDHCLFLEITKKGRSR